MTAARRVAAIACCVLGTMALLVGVVARWVDGQVFDSEEVVATTHSMLDLDSVRELIRIELDQRIEPMIQAEFVTLVDPAVVGVLDDPRFAVILDEAVRATHRALVAGDTERIVFSLAEVVPFIRAELDAIDPSISAQLPPLDGTLDYVLVRRAELPRIWTAIERFHRAAAALIVFGLILIALGLLLGPARWALLILIGVLTALFAVGVSAATGLLRRTIEDRIDEPGTRQAATDIAALFTHPLERQMTTLLIVAGLIVLAGIAVWLVRTSTGGGRDAGEAPPDREGPRYVYPA